MSSGVTTCGGTELFCGTCSSRTNYTGGIGGTARIINIKCFNRWARGRSTVAPRLPLRMAGQPLHHNKTALGDFYRRMRAKLDAPKAITAAAHKLARIIFHLVARRQKFDDSRFAADQLRHQKRQELKLRARAKAMGFELVPLPQAG